MNNIAFVTPTFGPDLERCELLVRSLDRFAPEQRHYLLIDGFEMPRFRHLQSKRTIILPAEEVIGLRQFRLHVRQNFWLNARTLPMRGWIRQQVLKLAAADHLGEDVLVCVDSDVAFIRPVSPGAFIEEGKIALLDVDYVDPMVERWTEVACRLLGINGRQVSRRGHVGHLISWSRDHVQSLKRRVEEVTGLAWQVAIGRQRTFSEYVLYGVFVREVLGYSSSQHLPSTRALVRQPWDHDLQTAAGLKDFICQPEPENVAVMVHSKFDIPTPRIRAVHERHWAQS